GPSRWRRPLSNSEPSISQGILIATGNSTSIRTSAAYTPSPGPSFQSSHTQNIFDITCFKPLHQNCGRALRPAPPTRAGGATGDGEHYAIHHAQAQAQGE